MTMFSPKTKDAWHIYYQQLLFSLEMLLKKIAIAEYFTLWEQNFFSGEMLNI